MADLLECVIQIKAVADTPRRLALRLREAQQQAPFDEGPVLRNLLAYERWFGSSIEAGLSVAGSAVGPEPALEEPPPDGARDFAGPTRDLLARFASLRAVVVRRLDSCSASQLSTTVLVAGRGPTTIADLVALALAHDTDTIARIVRGA